MLNASSCERHQFCSFCPCKEFHKLVLSSLFVFRLGFSFRLKRHIFLERDRVAYGVWTTHNIIGWNGLAFLIVRERKKIFWWIASIVQTQSMNTSFRIVCQGRCKSFVSSVFNSYFPLQWEPGKTLFPSLASTLGGQRSGGWWGKRRNPYIYLSWWSGYQVVYQEGLWERRWESSWQYLYFSRLEWSVVYWVLRRELKQTRLRRQRENLKM